MADVNGQLGHNSAGAVGQSEIDVASTMLYGHMLTAEMALNGHVDSAFRAIEDALDLYLEAIFADYGEDVGRAFAAHLIRRLTPFVEEE